MTQPLLRVAIAAVARGIPNGPRVLITRRRVNTHLARFWELPGGKIEPGESSLHALGRELTEELGWRPRQSTLDEAVELPPVEHVYADRVVRLHAFLITPGEGELAQLDAALATSAPEHRWASPVDLDRFELPPANGPINQAIQTLLTGSGDASD